MLVDRYTPEDVFARVPEVAEQTDPVLKSLDQLLEDDQLYRQVRPIWEALSLHAGAWATLDPGRSDPAHAHPQALVRVGLPGNRRAGGRQPGTALVLPRVFPDGTRQEHAHPASRTRCDQRRCTN